MGFEIKSSAFENGGLIPAEYTCDGSNLSPHITWKEAPDGTKSLALICDDTDAPVGAWVHWLLYNIPPEKSALPEGMSKSTNLPDGMMQGTNDFRRWGYGGPCPPSGSSHHYYFKLYALDNRLNIGAGVQKKDVERAMKGHVIEETVLVGKYGR